MWHDMFFSYLLFLLWHIYWWHGAIVQKEVVHLILILVLTNEQVTFSREKCPQDCLGLLGQSEPKTTIEKINNLAKRATSSLIEWTSWPSETFFKPLIKEYAANFYLMMCLSEHSNPITLRLLFMPHHSLLPGIQWLSLFIIIIIIVFCKQIQKCTEVIK